MIYQVYLRGEAWPAMKALMKLLLEDLTVGIKFLLADRVNIVERKSLESYNMLVVRNS
jgi:hypothetical protein